MKAILISCPKAGRIRIDAERFRRMISALNRDGIIGHYHRLHNKNQLLRILQTEQSDIVFSADCYPLGDSSESLSIHKILDDLEIPYIGSDTKTLDLVLSKTELKKKWILQDVSTPPFFTVQKSGLQVLGLEPLLLATDYPYILKPDREGNSRGLDESSIVFDQISLELKLSELLETYETVLIEEYLGTYPDFREFTVAMIGNGQHKLLMPAEIALKRKKKLRIITTLDKDNHNTRANLVYDIALKEKLIAIAERAFETTGVRDYARCDVILAGGQLFAIEINGQPMIPDKWFEVCAKGAGLNSVQYINAIFLAGLSRNIKMGRGNLHVPTKMQEAIPAQIFEKLMNA